MKLSHALFVAGAALICASYLEAFYEHPTYGRGLKAFAAAMQLARLA